MGNLDSFTNEAQLQAHFERMGPIHHVRIPGGKGCAFVRFEQRADAERAEYLAARAQTAPSAAMAALLAGPGAQPDEG